jgi:hypothetical protein
MIDGVLDSATDPAKTADIVLDAIRERRFYILPHPEEALDMAEQHCAGCATTSRWCPGLG